jgi:hypothetical protein
MVSNGAVGFRRADKSSALLPWLNAVLLVFLAVTPVCASNHYTDHQLDALATRVGKTYWIVAVKNQTPAFLSNPTANAASFHPQANESFDIIELVGRQEKNPYYKVKFNSGKEAFIHPEIFLEELNLSITSVDPQAIDRKKAAAAAEEEKKRIAWIQAQPWPRAVKEAAIKRKVMLGMSTREVRQILGKPLRVSKFKAQFNVPGEDWLYPDGSTVVFHNGLMVRVEGKPKTEPQSSTELQPSAEEE